MTTNFDCVGFEADDNAAMHRLLRQVLPRARAVGAVAGVQLFAWQDPSGARIMVGTDARGTPVLLMPSYAGEPGAIVAEVQPLHGPVVAVDVVDGAGETLTRLALELEQYPFVAGDGTSGGPATVVAMGMNTAAYDSPRAFDEGQRRLLDEADLPGPQAATESVLPLGLFAAPADATSRVQLSGTALRTEHRRNALTGRAFSVVRVRTYGLEVDVCLPGDRPAPPPGGVLQGQMYLTASMPHLVPGSRGLAGAQGTPPA